jgi:PTH1 family peptidyl-tRNA hydrolase
MSINGSLSGRSQPVSSAIAGRGADHFIIFGLGNIGSTYTGTRHNVGRDFVKRLSTEWRAPLVNKDASCDYSEALAVGTKLITLANPDTYMNVCGNAVRGLSARLGVPHSNLIVIHDDLEIPIGQAKVRNTGSANGTPLNNTIFPFFAIPLRHRSLPMLLSSLPSAGQNGVRDCLRALGAAAPFLRVRVGIGRPADPSTEIRDYVLGRFSPDEVSRLQSLYRALPTVLRQHAEGGAASVDTTAASLRAALTGAPAKGGAASAPGVSAAAAAATAAAAAAAAGRGRKAERIAARAAADAEAARAKAAAPPKADKKNRSSRDIESAAAAAAAVAASEGDGRSAPTDKRLRAVTASIPSQPPSQSPSQSPVRPPSAPRAPALVLSAATAAAVKAAVAKASTQATTHASAAADALLSPPQRSDAKG